MNKHNKALCEIADILEDIARRTREQANAKINPLQLLVDSQALNVNALSFLRCAMLEDQRVRQSAKAN